MLKTHAAGLKGIFFAGIPPCCHVFWDGKKSGAEGAGMLWGG